MGSYRKTQPKMCFVATANWVRPVYFLPGFPEGLTPVGPATCLSLLVTLVLEPSIIKALSCQRTVFSFALSGLTFPLEGRRSELCAVLTAGSAMRVNSKAGLAIPHQNGFVSKNPTQDVLCYHFKLGSVRSFFSLFPQSSRDPYFLSRTVPFPHLDLVRR